MGKLFYLIILVIDVMAIVDIVNSGKDNGKKVLWIVVVVFLPVLGPILYYLIGKRML
jgi:hypothetical protein